MNGQKRSNIAPGLEVDIVLKQDQRTGKLTRGIVKDILTNSLLIRMALKCDCRTGKSVEYKISFNKKRSSSKLELLFLYYPLIFSMKTTFK